MSLEHLSEDILMKYYQIFTNGMNKSKRFESRKKHKTDVKFLYNLVRLLEECDQILSEGDLDLMRSRELLKTVKRGEWTQEQVEDYCCRKEKTLEEMYAKSTLPVQPDEKKVRQVLLEILQHHYGSLEKHLPKAPVAAEDLIKEVKQLIKDHGF